MCTQKTVCPFCRQDKEALKGDGCCYCEYSGFVLVGEGLPFKNIQEADSHNPEVSLYDREINISNGRDPNFSRF